MYLIQSIKDKGAIDVICNKLSIAHLTAEKLNEIKISYPLYDEQTAIAAYLDQETARIDELIQLTEQSIRLIKERRSALITSAVTGKIDIREHQK
jgi:type I restriction enzyme S subunit